jgi:glycosyltransferase involved in cell wall biosynthesis
MERIICAIVDGTAPHCDHTILSLSGTIEAKAWIKSTSTRYVPFVKPARQKEFFASLYRQLQYIRPQVLMSYNWGATDAIWLGRIAKIQRIIHSEHGFNVDEAKVTHRKRDLIRSILYAISSKVVVVSRELQCLMKEKYRLRDHKLLRIPNGIDTQYYTPDEVEKKQTRASLRFLEQDIVVGFVGRLDPVKNLDFLLHVFDLCVKQDQKFKLLIVGDGPERDRLEHLCRQRNLQSHVNFTGQQATVLPYLRAIDVLLLTSLREQMPMIVLEAMAVGVPVIASDVGEIPYIIEDGVNGCVHTLDRGEKAFADSLHQLRSPSRRIAFGHAARRRIIETFQQATMVSRYQMLLTESTLRL